MAEGRGQMIGSIPGIEVEAGTADEMVRLIIEGHDPIVLKAPHALALSGLLYAASAAARRPWFGGRNEGGPK